MKPPVIYPLFSTPVYCQFDTGISVSATVMNMLKSLPSINDECGLSIDVNVLGRPELAELRELCEYHLDQYVREVCSFQDEFYITTSWLSRNGPGQDHYAHSHPNSIFSGCLYLQSSPDNRLTFYKQSHFSAHVPLTYTIKDLNIYNSDDWWIPVDTGTIVIFPSNLKHSASPNMLNDTRVALCFNTFVRGTFGGGGAYAGQLNLR